MSVSAIQDVRNVAPLRHLEAMGLARTAYARFADLLDTLDAEEWTAPTCCPGWTVRDMAGHVLGAMRSAASLREQGRQLRLARRYDGSLADGLTATQIAGTAGLSADEVRREVRALIDSATRGRRATPAPVRHLVRMRVELPVSGASEPWTLGYLVDRVLTRDVWMHRSDVAEATGRTFVVDGAHDGRVVADVVADWAHRHGRDVTLVLSGPAGGTFTAGNGGLELTTDAVAFCRALSGRGHELPYDTEVPF